MTEKQTGSEKIKTPRVEVYWTTVTYKTVIVYVLLGVAIIGLVFYLIAPDRFASLARNVGETLAGKGADVSVPMPTQARFVQFDGKVQVKKVNSVQWEAASSSIPLGKGDLVQTGEDGIARITFPDGSTYTLRQNSLITVEENSMAEDRRTQVAVKVSSGRVDLATGGFEPGSKSEVAFENARASLKQNTRAAVRSDPESNQHEFTVTTGGADLNRGGEVISIGRFERVSFPTGGAVQRAKVMAPPSPSRPVNFQPILSEDPVREVVRFEWQPVEGAVSYLLQVSKSSMFKQIVAERRTAGTTAELSGLAAGDYFWVVTAIDARKRPSEPSDTYKFTLAAQGKSQEMLLEVDPPHVLGASVEITGRTEPGATLLVNGQPVTEIKPDGRFRYFSPPMARGSQKLTVVGQNRRGGTAKKDLQVFIP